MLFRSDWLDKNSSNIVLFGGDFNVDLDKHDPVSDLINCFCSDNCLLRCDLILSTGIRHSTYVNESLGHESVIDYFLPARRYASAGLCDSDVSVGPSVCPSVCHTPVLCLAERKQDHEMYTI